MSFSTLPGYLAGHRWASELYSPTVDDIPPPPGSKDPRRLWTRALGVLETKFDKATQTDGQSDTFLRLALSLDASPPAADPADLQDAFLSRVLLAWAALRAKHPLLACTVRDAYDEKHPAIPLVQTREFALLPPQDADEALQHAGRAFLVHTGKPGSVQEAADEVQDRLVLNGPRALLSQEECLARLVVVRSEEDPLKLGFLLVISHVISDGLSVFKLVNELFTLASSPALPSPPTSAPFVSLAAYLEGAPEPARWPSPTEVAAAWRVVMPEADLLAHLPLANEEHYPPLPLSPSPPPPVAPAQATENPPATAPPPLTHPPPPFCKASGVSPSMLLYSLISLSVARIFARVHANEPYHPIVLGFPFSARPFLQRVPPFSPPTACSDPSSDCAIRITFGCIALPSLPFDPSDPAQAPHIRAAALRGARLAKTQFAANLAPEPKARTVFLAGMYAMILDRLLNGTGRNPIPYNEPKTALNASMIGDVDRLLPTSFPLPSPSGATLHVRDIAIGTRLHRGEGMLLEAFTWDGRVTLCLGVDDGLMDPKLVDELLEGVRELAEVVADGVEG
ncbi:hypothetical protein JCM10449v2_004398 [Rhodotorula kratochvilovae]